MHRSVISACFALIFAVGCRSVALEGVTPHHIVMMNSRGKVIDPTGNTGCTSPYGERCNGRHTIWSGYRELSNFETAEYAEQIVEQLRNHKPSPDGKRRVLIFIHGGLNSGVGAIRRATRLQDTIHKAGYYPIFVNWNSALISSYREHIFYVRQGEHWGKNPLSLGLTPFYFLADLFRSIAKTPVAWFQMIRSDRESRPKSAKHRMATEEVQRLTSRVVSDRESTITIHAGRDLRTASERRTASVGYVATLPTKLVTVPVIDGLGSSAWETLIRRARVLFHTDEEMSISRVQYRALDPSSKGELHPLGGLSIVMRRVATFVATDGRDWEVTIVAHSMGAIVANELIRTYAEKSSASDVPLPIRNVIYFAAATSLRDYEDTIFPFLRAHGQRRMFHLTLHRAAEVRDTVTGLKLGAFDIAPRGSLLVWIDNYLSRPNIPLDRTAGRFVNLMTEVHNVPPAVASQIYIREFDAGDAAGRFQPQHHGEFGFIRFWDEKCWQPATDYETSACYQPWPRD